MTMTNNPDSKAPDRIWAWPNEVENNFMAACRENEPPPNGWAEHPHEVYMIATPQQAAKVLLGSSHSMHLLAQVSLGYYGLAHKIEEGLKALAESKE